MNPYNQEEDVIEPPPEEQDPAIVPDEGVGSIEAPDAPTESVDGPTEDPFSPRNVQAEIDANEKTASSARGGSVQRKKALYQSLPVDPNTKFKYFRSDGGAVMTDGSIVYKDGTNVIEHNGVLHTEYPDGSVHISADPRAKPDKIGPEAQENHAAMTAATKGVTRGMFQQGPDGDKQYMAARNRALGYFPPTADIGDAALAEESPSMRNRIEGIIEGHIKPPPNSRNNPLNNHIWDLIYAKDPHYTEQSFTNFKNFTTGKDADSLTALDAAAQHLATLKEDFSKVDPGKFKGINTWANLINSNTDDPDLKKVQGDVIALQAQLAGYYKGQGRSATDPEMEKWHQYFDVASGPKAMDAAINGTVDLLRGQYQAQKNKFLRVSGQNDTSFQFIKPQTQKMLKARLGSSLDEAPETQQPEGGVVAPEASPASGAPIARPPMAPAYKEGDDLTDSKGVRRIFHNGQWVAP